MTLLTNARQFQVGILPEVEDDFESSEIDSTINKDSTNENLDEETFTAEDNLNTKPQEQYETLSWIFSQDVPLLGFDWQISDTSGDLQVLAPLFYNS